MRHFVSRLLYYTGLCCLALIFGFTIGYCGPLVFQAWHFVLTSMLGFW